jgi:hypothetical protein
MITRFILSDEDIGPPLELSGGGMVKISSIEEFPQHLIPVEVPPHVVMLRGIGEDSNTYLVRDSEEALIVDTGTGMIERLLEFEVGFGLPGHGRSLKTGRKTWSRFWGGSDEEGLR